MTMRRAERFGAFIYRKNDNSSIAHNKEYSIVYREISYAHLATVYR